MAAKREPDADTEMGDAPAAAPATNWELVAILLTTGSLLVSIVLVVMAASPYGGLTGE
ncbi:MAG: hypothetical protein JNJ88_06470 [Planctomycetes bacterium]|nr:hypothetical protein [Planctomycetota bacterium]